MQLIGGSVRKGLESLMKGRKVTKITDIVRKENKVMTQEEVKAKMQEGLAKIQPKVVEMTNIIMDASQEGFNTCFELLTGQKFK